MAEPVPTPKIVLRGHKAQVHVAVFLRNNERLATGDADGYVILWDLTIMRPRAVWRAHESAILGIRGWGCDRIVTHGRDHKLIVWRIGEEDEEILSSVLPLEDVPASRPHPWILHILQVNTMNFCSFAACSASLFPNLGHVDDASQILIAVPNTLASEAIDIYELPSQQREYTIQTGKGNGMVMSLSLLSLKESFVLIAAFENGHCTVHRQQPNSEWIMTYRTQTHTQPILSLSLHPSQEYFLTSGADATIAKHPIPMEQQELMPEFDPENRIIEELDDTLSSSNPSLLSAGLNGPFTRTEAPKRGKLKEWEHPLKTVNTKHAGQQGLTIRSDGRIFSTAGWDSNIRVYSCKTLKELAVLQWHRVGCYAVAFADIAGAHSPNFPSPQFSCVNEPFQTDRSGSCMKKMESVKEKRIMQAKTAHWIAAGDKNGKISLWDIY